MTSLTFPWMPRAWNMANENYHYCGFMHGSGEPHAPTVRCLDKWLSERVKFMHELNEGNVITASGYVCGPKWQGKSGATNTNTNTKLN